MGDKKDSWDAAKDFQSSKGDKPDSSKDFARAEHQARNDYQDVGSPWGALSDRDRSSKEDSPSRDSDDGGSRVICTHLVKLGKMDKSLWRADVEFTKRLSQTTVQGYHFWAIPYVKLMRRYAFPEWVVRPLAVARAKEVAHVMGLRKKGSLAGKVVRCLGEPACWILGTLVQAQDWRSLYSCREAKREA